MDGANLRGGLVEVAFEQWTERRKRRRIRRGGLLVDFNVFPTLQGSSIGEPGYVSGRIPVLAECRDGKSLNLGGNADSIFALSV